MRPRRGLPLLLAATLLGWLAGCGSSSQGAGAGPGPDDDWTIDAGARCHALAFGAPVIGTPGNTPHAPAGGSLTAGTYHLVQAYLNGTTTMRSVMRISGNRVQWAFHSDDITLGRREYRHAGTFTTSGTRMTTVRSCEFTESSRSPPGPDGGMAPAHDPSAFPVRQEYSAVGNRIHIFDGWGGMLVLQR